MCQVCGVRRAPFATGSVNVKDTGPFKVFLKFVLKDFVRALEELLKNFKELRQMHQDFF